MASRTRRLDQLVFALLILAYLIPLWRHRYFPSQDGPLHVGNAAVIAHYWDPSPNIFREAYRLDYTLRSNYLSHLILSALLKVASPEIAEKIFLSLYVILVPCGFAFALTAISSDALFLSVFAFPFIYNYPLHMGFYNFSLCFLIFLYMLGVLLRGQNGFTTRRAILLGILGVLGVLAHVTSVSAFLVAFAVVTVITLIADIRSQPENIRHLLINKLARPLFGLAPLLLLLASFFKEYGATGRGYLPKDQLWSDFIQFRSLVSFHPVEQRLATVLVASLFALAFFGVAKRCLHNQWKRLDSLLVLAIVYFGLYFFAPAYNSAGGAINARLMLYPFVALLLWLATTNYGRALRYAVEIGGTALALAFIVHFDGVYGAADARIQEFLSVRSYIAPDSVLYPIDLDGGGSTRGAPLSNRVNVFHTTAGYLVAEQPLIDLRNIEGVERHCPTKFTDRYNPGGMIAFEMPGINPEVDILKYGRERARPIDYVLLWDRPKDVPGGNGALVTRQIEHQGYVKIYQSESAAMTLFRRPNLNDRVAQQP